MVSRSRTVNPPHGDLVLSWVSICASPNLDILGVKFEDHSKTICVVLSIVSPEFGILILVKRVFLDTSVLLRCYYAFGLPILEYCSSVWLSAAECHLQLLERQVYSVAGCVLIRVSCRCVVRVILLLYVCCTRLIGTGNIVYSMTFHVLLSELNIPEDRRQLIHWSLK